MTAPLLEVRNLRKYFPVRAGVLLRKVGDVHAVDDVSFTLEQGRTLGLVGESGCGKTTVGRTLLNLLPKSGGQVLFEGRDLGGARPHRVARDAPPDADRVPGPDGVAERTPHRRTNPRGAVRDSRSRRPCIPPRLGQRAARASRPAAKCRGPFPARVLGRPAAAHRHSARDRAETEVHRLRRSRLGARCLDPSADHQSAARAATRDAPWRCCSSPTTSPSYGTCRTKSPSCTWARSSSRPPATEIYARPAHPYTRALISAIPLPDPNRKRERIVLQGDVPSPINPPTGCRFHTRCPFATDVCRTAAPAWEAVSPQHHVACHHWRDLPPT